MSGPTGPVRDSSLQDRKAPGVLFRRTPQPRPRNVGAARRKRYPIPTDSPRLWFRLRVTCSIRSAINRGLTFRMAQTPVQHYLPQLMQRIQKGEIDPSFVITHRVGLEDGPEMYKTFRDKQDGCVKVVMRP